MSALADHIDRFSSTVKSIRTTASALSDLSSNSQGPFTRAVLKTPLGDLIRDIDSSELGLFTLVTPTHQDKPKDKVTRVEFPGATPLRRPAAARRDDAMRIKELEPEIYTQAALKYLDRYQSIRPMPRARSQVEVIIEQLATTRAHIQSLNQALADKGSSNSVPLSPKSQANAEERRIQELQTKIAQLKKRKEALSKPKPRSKLTHAKPTTKSAQSSSPSTSITPSLDDTSKDTSQDSEAAFWQTPAAPARILHFTDTMLMDEQPDLGLGDVSTGDISTLSFESPTKTDSAESSFDLGVEVEIEPAGVDDSLVGTDEPEEEDEGEKTIVLPKAPPASSPPVEPMPSEPPAAHPEVPTPARQPKVRVNSETERIANKIWSTVGEIIMPGHHFDTSGAAGSSKPPRAKETVAHLLSLSSEPPSPASPSSASLSSISGATHPPSSGQPTTQQILTAHLLLALLSSPPHFSMPFNKLKEVLATKVTGDDKGAATNLLGGQVTTRALYACVAKKLVKIERGSGEQVVKFDV